MGSLALAYHDASEFRMEMKRKAEHEVNLLRPPALLHWDDGDGEQPPPLDERRRIVQRWIEYEKRKGPRRFEYLPGLVHLFLLNLIRYWQFFSYCTSLCIFLNLWIGDLYHPPLINSPAMRRADDQPLCASLSISFSMAAMAGRRSAASSTGS
uniref:Uncharacterized protein n=1 Tax=Oryza glumipatula TaxID=40148 RepID=A0A0D9Y7M9_9ORYZ